MKYDYKQISEMLGITRMRIADIVSRYKVPKEVTDNKVWLSEKSVSEIKKHITNKKMSGFWKVSVFDEKINKFIVKAVSLSYTQAKDICMEYSALGVLSRFSRHKTNAKNKYIYV